MGPRTMVALNLAGTAALVSVLFWFGRDHSLYTLARWLVLLLSALVVPMYWSGKLEAELARLPGPITPRLKRAPLYPIATGIMTLCAGLALIERLP